MQRTPIHPGIILQDELEEIGLSHQEIATLLKVPENTIQAILEGKSPLSADLALRLSRYFGTTAEFWLNLQKIYDLDLAKRNIGESLLEVPQRTI